MIRVFVVRAPVVGPRAGLWLVISLVVPWSVGGKQVSRIFGN